MFLLIGYIALGVLVVIFLVTLGNLFLAPELKKQLALKNTPKVSLLVPARNEENNIARCVTSLLEQDYPNYEIIALDDNSTDNTRQILETFQSAHPEITLMSGRSLPDGWTGKNGACQQLGEAANGEIFIFTDADNWHQPTALRKTVVWMQQYNLDLFSAFPQQVTKTLAEKLIIPMIDMLVYSILPLWLTYYSSKPSLAAANGQWLAVTAPAYKILGGHFNVRHTLVEDTELARLAKRQGLKMLTAAGTGEVYARMYTNASEVWQGMTRILFGLVGYRTLLSLVILLLMFLAGIVPYILVWFAPFHLVAGLVIIINSLARFLLSIRYKHPVLISLFLHPVTVFLVIIISLNSIRKSYTNEVTWKGRSVKVRSLISTIMHS